MKKISLFASAAAALMLSFNTISAQTWSLDKAHSKIGFTITHMAVSDVDGNFKAFDANLTSSKEDFSDAALEFTANVASINTDNEQRDKHLQGADFFDAAKYPTITFKSKSIKKVSGNNYKITGDLTMHGVTKSVTLDAAIATAVHPMSKKTIAGVRVTGAVKRTDYGVGAANPMLGDEVLIKGSAEFAKN